MNLFPDILPTDKPRIKRGGHAAAPGSGPESETCRTCQHVESVVTPAGRYFHKCGLMQRCWTRGAGTDIKLKDPACRFWEGNLKDTDMLGAPNIILP